MENNELPPMDFELSVDAKAEIKNQESKDSDLAQELESSEQVAHPALELHPVLEPSAYPDKMNENESLADAVLDEPELKEDDAIKRHLNPQVEENDSTNLEIDSNDDNNLLAENKSSEDLEEPIIVNEAILEKSNKEMFNPMATQQILERSEAPEGGVFIAKAKGVTISTNTDNGGGLIKPAVDMQADSIQGKYEVTGFEAIYDSGGQSLRVSIRDYFDDLNTAKASIIDGKYLMPIPGGTYKIADIKGSPTINFNERQLYVIKNGEWNKL